MKAPSGSLDGPTVGRMGGETFLVAGASGNVGGAAVRSLVAMGERVRAVVRSGSAPDGVEVVSADLADRDSMRPVLSGVTAAFLLGGYGDAPGLLADLAAARVRRVVLLSTGAVVGGDLDNIVVRSNVVGEAAVRDSGLGWTVLRPSGFMSNTLQWTAQLRAGDVVEEPFADVPIAVIDPDDIGAVAAQVLVEGDSHQGRSYRLTGPDVLSPIDRARMLGDVLGRTIELRPEPDDDARRRLESEMGAAYADAFFQFFRRGGYDDAHVTDVVPELLGRPPQTFGQWAQRHADAFR